MAACATATPRGRWPTPAKLPGFWNAKTNQWDEDPYQVGTDTGPVAWAMLLWAALGMTAPANKAGNFLDEQLRAPLGYYGGFYGFNTTHSKINSPGESTEQNLDLAVAFRETWPVRKIPPTPPAFVQRVLIDLQGLAFQ